MQKTKNHLVMNLSNNKKIFKFFKFMMVGILNTFLDIGVLNLLVFVFKIEDPLIFSICKGFSFMVALLNSYFMNKYFTFAKAEKSKKEFYLFVLVNIVSLLVNMIVSGLFFYLLLKIGFSNKNIIASLSAFIGSGFSMFINYLGYVKVVFR